MDRHPDTGTSENGAPGSDLGGEKAAEKLASEQATNTGTRGSLLPKERILDFVRSHDTLDGAVDTIDAMSRIQSLPPEAPPVVIRESQPGAFSGHFGVGRDGMNRRAKAQLGEQPAASAETVSSTADNTPVTQENRPAGLGIHMGTPLGRDLAKARLVHEESACVLDLPVVPVDEDAEREKTTVNRKKALIGGAAISFVCLAIGIVVVVVLVHGNNKADQALSGLPPSASPSVSPSLAPSSAPTGSLDLMLKDLPSYTQASLKDSSTPQWLAYDWLSYHPELPSMPEWRKTQLFSLATLFYSMEGELWLKPIRERWMQYENGECSWFSSSIGWFNEDGSYYEDLFSDVLPCTEEGRFQSLWLAQLDLPEEARPFLPPELSLLTSLSVLWLEAFGVYSSLDSFLPSEMFQMTNLTEVSFNLNDFTGPIPSQFGLLTQLTTLGLFLNPLMTGTIPSELGQLVNMENLQLWGNSHSGEIPSELGFLHKTTTLALADNALAGSIPSEIRSLTALEQLFLQENRLTGPIDAVFGEWAVDGSLRGLSLESNGFSGTIPSGLCSLGPINQTEWLGLSFDCGGKLCGCACACDDGEDGETTSNTTI